MSVVSGDPARLRGLSARVVPELEATVAAADDYVSALVAFTAAPNDVATPHLPDLGPTVDEVVVQLTDICATVEVFAEELESLDRDGRGVRTVPAGDADAFLAQVRRRADEFLRASADQSTYWSLGVHGSRAAVHGTRLVVNGHRLLALRREATFAGHLLPPGVTGRLVAIERMRAGLAPHVQQTGRAVRDGADALRTSRPVTPVGEWMSTATSGPGRWLRVGSKSLGGLGAVVSTVDSAQGFAEGDRERGWSSGAMAAGSAAMLFPPTAIGGSIVVGGALIYEHREAIGDGLRVVGDHVRSGVSTVGDVAGRVGSTVADGARDAKDAVLDWFG